MKGLLIALVGLLLASCTADQQQRFADGYFGESGHTFKQAMTGVGNDLGNGISRFGTAYAEANERYRAENPQQSPESGISTGWIGDKRFHTYTSGGITTGHIGDEPINVIHF